MAINREHPVQCADGHFRTLGEWTVSSIGLGTYLGDADDATDALYAQAIGEAVRLGCNLLDTAINYRCQRSERVLGATLRRLIGEGTLRREDVVLCTKAGYLPFDGSVPDDPGRYVAETFLDTGLVPYDELVAGCHCLAPGYLEHQLQTSLRNLQVDRVEIFYLHNPEQQLDAVARPEFLRRMEAAFVWLEAQVRRGRIGRYGTATWNGYRINPTQAGFLSLEELIGVACRIGGAEHHFRVVQLPYNLAMPEAFGFKNQTVDGTPHTLLEAAHALGVCVVASASLLQQRLAHLPAPMAGMIPGLRTDAQRAIQFVRSTPGLTTALVGMKRVDHTRENLEVAQVAPMAPEQIQAIFTRPR